MMIIDIWIDRICDDLKSSLDLYELKYIGVAYKISVLEDDGITTHMI